LANLWQFFGLPDPEVQTPLRTKGKEMGKSKKPKLASSRQGADMQGQQTFTTIRNAIAKSKMSTADQQTSSLANWKGARTPDGEPFHDLAGDEWQQRTKKLADLPSKALRYVMPDEMHRLPYDGMARRLGEGDNLVVDIRSLIHMDAQQSACRRMLREMANESGIIPFALDEDEKLLLIPGKGNIVDFTAYELGISHTHPLL
jgi:hypothetical protein